MMRLSALLLAALCALAPAAHAYGREDHAGIGQTIVIEENAEAGDIACAFCKVIIHGSVQGDIAVAFGTLQLDPGRTISGDVATFGTRIRLGEGSIITGDLAAVAGSYSESGATVDGSRVVAPSPLWLLIPVAPLLIFIGVIWLIIHALRGRSYAPPPYPMPPAR